MFLVASPGYITVMTQVSLESEVVPDPMEGEQTWPTEEELREAEGKGKMTSHSALSDL